MVAAVESILRKAPPSTNENEAGLLGALIVSPVAIDDVVEIIRPEDFLDPAHVVIFRHMLALHEAGKRPDFPLLHASLSKAKELEIAGGPAYLHSIFEFKAGFPGNERFHATEIREKAILRSLVDVGISIAREAHDASADAKRVLGEAERKVLAIADSRGGSAVVTAKSVIDLSMERIGDLMAGKIVQKGVSTGLADLDKVTSGLHGSELIVIAGRPSMGKTALAMNIAEAVAVKQSKPTLFASLEMSRIELGHRMLSSLAKVDGHRLRNGLINNYELDDVMRAASEFQDSQLFIDDSPSRSVSEIAAAARRVKRRAGGLACLVIDYLQLIEPDNPKDPRQEQVAKITRRLKGLARELDVPVVVLAQLNRQSEVGTDHRPRLSHLRESGAIEQDADVVLFVHREEYYASGERKKDLAGQAEIIVAKQRNGPVEDVKVQWQKDYTRFVTLPQPDNYEESFDNFK